MPQARGGAGSALSAAGAVLCAPLLLACGSDGGAPSTPQPPALAAPVPLTQAESWLLAPPEGDPFLEFEPGRVRCTDAALLPEGLWIEVSTVTCNYASLVFTFTEASRAGNLIRGEIAWSTLAAIDPAVATLAFALGEQVLWSHEVAIPGTANLVSVELTLPRIVNAGDALYFHVRNHGYNSWQLSPLALGPP